MLAGLILAIGASTAFVAPALGPGSVASTARYAASEQQLFAAAASSGRWGCARAARERAAGALMLAKPKKDMLEMEGEVLEALPNAMFRVQLDDTEQARSYLPHEPTHPCTADAVHHPAGATPARRAPHRAPPLSPPLRRLPGHSQPYRSFSRTSLVRSARTISRSSSATT